MSRDEQTRPVSVCDSPPEWERRPCAVCDMPTGYRDMADTPLCIPCHDAMRAHFYPGEGDLFREFTAAQHAEWRAKRPDATREDAPLYDLLNRYGIACCDHGAAPIGSRAADEAIGRRHELWQQMYARIAELERRAAPPEDATREDTPEVLPAGVAWNDVDLWDAYVAGAQGLRYPKPTEGITARAADAYVKLAHLRRLEAP